MKISIRLFWTTGSAALFALTASAFASPVQAQDAPPPPPIQPPAISAVVKPVENNAAKQIYPLAPLRPNATPTFEVDTSDVPDNAFVKAWAEQAKTLCTEWYPIVSAYLATEDAHPRKTVKLVFNKTLSAPAYSTGDAIHVSVPHITANPNDYGMMIHEMTHVIQAYPGGRDKPGWLVEGIADYIRYWKYEPEKPHRKINPARSDYHDGYGVAPEFLAWIVYKYDRRAVHTLDKAMRGSRFNEDIWKDITGKSLDDLWKEFAATLPPVNPPAAGK